MPFDKPLAASHQLKSQKLHLIFSPYLREPHEKGDRQQARAAYICLVILIQQCTG